MDVLPYMEKGSDLEMGRLSRLVQWNLRILTGGMQESQTEKAT
jgi:hypothetical protein